MRDGVFDLIGEMKSRGWFLRLEDLIEIVVRNPDRNLSFAIRNPEFRICSPRRVLLSLALNRFKAGVSVPSH